MINRNPIRAALSFNGRRLLLVIVMIAAMASTAFGVVLVDYSADTLPPPPWMFISDGPPAERSQHTVFVQKGVLHMIDNALLSGNTLGFLQFVPFDPNQIIEVEFRARVLSGESVLDERAPFEVWLDNGTVRADLSVGPQSITALGSQESRPFTPIIILNKPINGTKWHVYRYRLDPSGIQWWVDGISVGSATTAMLLPSGGTPTEFRRINMMITSATANVELDYLIVKQTPQPPCTLNLEASFADETLTLDFNLGTREPATWNVWLTSQSDIIRLVSAPLPVIDPAIPFPITIPFFPHLGTIGFLTTLTTAEAGIICSDFKTVDTDSISESVASTVEFIPIKPSAARV